MPLLYDFDMDSAADLAKGLAQRTQQRRLEKGLSREALSLMSGIPSPTIAKFEQHGTISLVSFLALAKALSYADEIRQLMTQPKFDTMEELDVINKNKNRKRGRNEFDK